MKIWQKFHCNEQLSYIIFKKRQEKIFSCSLFWLWCLRTQFQKVFVLVDQLLHVFIWAERKWKKSYKSWMIRNETFKLHAFCGSWGAYLWTKTNSFHYLPMIATEALNFKPLQSKAIFQVIIDRIRLQEPKQFKASYRSDLLIVLLKMSFHTY